MCSGEDINGDGGSKGAGFREVLGNTPSPIFPTKVVF